MYFKDDKNVFYFKITPFINLEIQQYIVSDVTKGVDRGNRGKFPNMKSQRKRGSAVKKLSPPFFSLTDARQSIFKLPYFKRRGGGDE